MDDETFSGAKFLNPQGSAFALTSYDSETALTFQWTSAVDASPAVLREDNKYVALEYRTKPQKEA